MPSNDNKKKKLAWKSDSIEGALLFLLFHKRIFNPNDFSASEIQQDPLYEFEKFSSTEIPLLVALVEEIGLFIALAEQHGLECMATNSICSI